MILLVGSNALDLGIGSGTAATSTFGWLALTVVTVMILVFALRLSKRASQDLLRLSERLSDEDSLEAAFATIAQRTSNAVILTDIHRKITWVNEGFTRITGYTLDEVRGKNPGQLLQFEKTDPNSVRAIREALQDARPVRETLLNKGKDGRQYWLDLDIQPRFDKHGELVGFMAIESDVTELKETERRLREQLSLSEALFSNTGAVVFVLDGEGRFRRFNRAAEVLTGFTSEEVIGCTPREFVVPEDEPDAFGGAAIDTMLGGDAEPADLVACWRTRDNEKRLLQWSRRVMGSQGDLGVMAVWVGIDITDRQRAHLQLQAAEAQAQEHLREAEALRSTIDNQSIVSVTDPQGRITDCNSMFTMISGYTREELIGETHAIVNSGHHPKSFWVNMWRTIASGNPWRDEVCNRAKDGSLYWVDTIIAPFHDADGRITKFVSVRTDITERKHAEERLRWSESQLVKAQQVGRIGSWSLDLVSGVLEWSDMIYELFEIDPTRFDASYEAFLDVVHPEDRQLVNEAYTSSVENRTEYSIVHRLLMPDGRIKHVHERCDTTYADDGTPLRSLGTVQDVTEIKLVEEELRVALCNADDANRAKSEFLANMSHEIRTPMTAILGYAELLFEEGDIERAPKGRRETIQTIRRNGEHLLAIINDILDVSKIEAGQMTVERIRTSPAQIVEEVASTIRARARSKGLEFAVHYETPLPVRIVSDPTRLRQILLNLAGNAIKFTATGNVTIHVMCDPVARQMRYRVADTGIGMTAQQLDAIARFESFAQSDATMARRFGGTGLGLRISNSLATLLGGGIKIESVKGKGSIFTVTIDTGDLDDVPMIDPERTPRFGALSPSEERGDGVVGDDVVPLAGYRVLLAEDGLDNQRLISFHLKKAGAEVVVCENGRIAAETVESASDADQPDVILMDIQMPELNGYDATRRLRDGGCEIPIIALTAHAMEGDRQACIEVGCDEYLTKPIDKHALIQLCAEYALRSRIARRAA